MKLARFDIIIINTSGGKDSICAIHRILQLAQEQDYPKSRIHLSHQDLGESEWPGVKGLVIEQADYFGLNVEFEKRIDHQGQEESLLQYVERRGKWPGRNSRFCTSDMKRGPGAKVITRLTKGMGSCKVLYVFGFRKSESPARKKKHFFKKVERHCTSKRTVYEYLPIHSWTDQKVWDVIKSNKIPYHKAYDLGMPRLSCVFCIYSPFDALVLAGIQNPDLLQKYVDLEKKIGHSFQDKVSLVEVQNAIADGHTPGKIASWVM